MWFVTYFFGGLSVRIEPTESEGEGHVAHDGGDGIEDDLSCVVRSFPAWHRPSRFPRIVSLASHARVGSVVPASFHVRGDPVHLVHVSTSPCTVLVCSCASCSTFLTSWVKFPPIMVRLAFPPSPPLPLGDPLPNPAMPIPLSPSPSHPLPVDLGGSIRCGWVWHRTRLSFSTGRGPMDPIQQGGTEMERERDRERVRE